MFRMLVHHHHTTPAEPHRNTPTHIEPEQYNTWNKSTISRKLVKMDVLTFETCWAVNSEIIKQVTSIWSIFIQLKQFYLKEDTNTVTDWGVCNWLWQLFVLCRAIPFKNTSGWSVVMFFRCEIRSFYLWCFISLELCVNLDL